MKINRRNRTSGSVLITAAGAAAVLAIVIAGYLTYQTNEYNMNFRAHRFNQAFHLAESAVELGIAEFNYPYTQGGSGFQSGNGWTGSGGAYTKTVSNLTDSGGNVVGTFAVTTAGVGTANPSFTGVGTVTSSNYGGQSIARAVKVILAGSSSLFPDGIVAKSPLSLTSSFSIDSYDSSDPTKSTNGQYDSSKRQANGNIATTSSSASAVALANSADVYGTIATGTGGSVTIADSAKVGPSLSTQTGSPATGVADGWITSAFTSVPTDVSVPSTLTSAANLGTISVINSSTMTISAGSYRVNSLSASNSAIITISGNVSLYVLGNVSFGDSSQVIVPSGSTLTVYIGGTSASLANSGVINSGGRPINNQWFGLPSVTSVTLASSSIFNGTFYAPEAALTIANSARVSGALVANSLSLANSGAIHYDQSLKGSGGGSGTSYNVVSWQELRYVSGSWIP